MQACRISEGGTWSHNALVVNKEVAAADSHDFFTDPASIPSQDKLLSPSPCRIHL